MSLPPRAFSFTITVKFGTHPSCNHHSNNWRSVLSLLCEEEVPEARIESKYVLTQDHAGYAIQLAVLW